VACDLRREFGAVIQWAPEPQYINATIKTKKNDAARRASPRVIVSEQKQGEDRPGT
jgi:hypothetical protein